VQATAKTRTDAVISQAFVDYPQLNDKSATYDKALVGKINRMQMSYVADGQPADEALAAAILDFMPAVAAAVDTGKTAADLAAAKIRNAKAAGAQPPGLGGVGTGERARAAAADVTNYTDAEFAALPDREKKRLRGD
jgi:hypothetical protein